MIKTIFPQFTRFFPAGSVSQVASVVLRASIWLLLALFVGTNIGLAVHPIRQQSNVLGAEVASGQNLDLTAVQKQFDSWKDVVANHPDYRDGYYMLSLLAYQLRKFEESRAYLATVKHLDPNFGGISEMEALLSKE